MYITMFFGYHGWWVLCLMLLPNRFCKFLYTLFLEFMLTCTCLCLCTAAETASVLSAICLISPGLISICSKD